MPTPAKTTLNVTYRLTTEMGNVQVTRIVPACLPVPARPHARPPARQPHVRTSVSHNIIWKQMAAVMLTLLLKIKYWDQSFIIVMVLSELMAL